MKTMSAAQIEALRTAYSAINTVDPTGPSYESLIDLLDGASPQLLKQLAGAGIKFVSRLAMNRVR
jgi:hypothetical protein